MRVLTLSAVILGLCLVSASAQDQCPGAKTAWNGFIVERGDRSKTEVLYAGATDVRTMYQVDGRTLLEVTLFQGLFELERLYRGKRTVYRPVSDLAKAYPLAPGKKVTAIFEETLGDRTTARTYVLEVRKEVDTLTLGACKYAVLLIDRSRLDDKSKPVFMYTDYYAPDLRLVLGKGYRERDGRTTLIKFDRISPKPAR